jgi:hypothetical protein
MGERSSLRSKSIQNLRRAKAGSLWLCLFVFTQEPAVRVSQIYIISHLYMRYDALWVNIALSKSGLDLTDSVKSGKDFFLKSSFPNQPAQ